MSSSSSSDCVVTLGRISSSEALLIDVVSSDDDVFAVAFAIVDDAFAPAAALEAGAAVDALVFVDSPTFPLLAVFEVLVLVEVVGFEVPVPLFGVTLWWKWQCSPYLQTPFPWSKYLHGIFDIFNLNASVSSLLRSGDLGKECEGMRKGEGA